MKKLDFDFSGVTQIDWARLAAFIDGEGHIRVVTKTQTVKGRVYLQDYVDLGVSNTKPALMVWLTKTFGGSIQSNGRAVGCKPAWNWNVAAAHASDILRGCMPYFILKGQQAELALAFYATMKRRGVKGTPIAVRDERQRIKSQLRVLTARGPQTPVAVNE